MKLFKVNVMTIRIKYWKPKNEFQYSPPWRGVGVGLLKNIFTFLVSNILPYNYFIRL